MEDLLVTDLATALDHAIDPEGPDADHERRWWRAVHQALEEPVSLTDEELDLLPEPFRDALDLSDDAMVEGWLDSAEISDRIWQIGSHCPQDRQVVAHLAQAAAHGAPLAIAEFIGRDLLRMAAIDGGHDSGGHPSHGDPDVWGGPAAAIARVDEAAEFLSGLGVTPGRFRDLYDTVSAGTAMLPVDAIHSAGERWQHPEPWSSTVRLTIGRTVVVEAGGLYDRQVLQILDRDHRGHISGREVVSGLTCSLVPSPRHTRWTLHVQP